MYLYMYLTWKKRSSILECDICIHNNYRFYSAAWMKASSVARALLSMPVW